MTDAEKLVKQFQEERDAHVREDIEADNPHILSDLSPHQVVQSVAQIQYTERGVNQNAINNRKT